MLKFARDRRRWRHWLFVAQRRFGLTVLNYIATSNHIHILVVDQGNNEIAASMQLIAGRTAQEYNNRKNRNGAFWEDRYHSTAVQSDFHLMRCLIYIDLNMVRAGVTRHPRDWEVSGYHEIQVARRRKGIVDHSALYRLTGMSTAGHLQCSHAQWIADELENSQRDSIWTESVGVGDKAFLIDLRSRLGVAGIHKKIRSVDDITYVCEPKFSYKCPILTSKMGN